MRQIENSLGQKSPRDAGPIMRSAPTTMPHSYESVQLEQGQSPYQRCMTRAQRSQFRFQAREESLLQNLSECTEDIV